MLSVPIQVLEVGDESDEGGLPDRGRKLWDLAVREGERGAGRGREVISHVLAH